MTRHIYILFATTFFFGMVTGGITYLTVHTGEGGGDSIEASATGIEITARMYGGCAMAGNACPQYRIKNDGTYTYRYIDEQGTFAQKQGSVTKVEMADLRDAIGQLKTDAHKPFDGECPVISDGIAFQYDILSRGEVYHFDSCEQSLDGDVLFDTLQDFFDVFYVDDIEI